MDGFLRRDRRPKRCEQILHVVELDTVQLASILGANRENLVRQNMLEKDHSQEQAETEVDLLVSVMKYLGRARLSVGSHDGRPRAGLELKLNLP